MSKGGSGGGAGGSNEEVMPWNMSYEQHRRTYGPGGPKNQEVIELKRQMSIDALKPRERRPKDK